MKRINRVLSNSNKAIPKWKYCLLEWIDDGAIGLIKINRPKELNALNVPLVKDIVDCIKYIESNLKAKCIILTGVGKAFVAGADIKMVVFLDQHILDASIYVCISRLQRSLQTLGIYRDGVNFFSITFPRSLPIISAVNGYALGGGCEVAMMTDIIIASEKAIFGQPEITIGTIPGLGGSQRLPKAVGKSNAMDMILTGKKLTAKDMKELGLVSRVVPHEKLIDEALKTARSICRHSRVILILAKRAVNLSYELPLQQGIRAERTIFHETFGTRDQKNGMRAFTSRQRPKWEDK